MPELQSDCAHVTDTTLLAFYRWHPELMPACCALEGRAWLVAADGVARAFPAEPAPQHRRG